MLAIFLESVKAKMLTKLKRRRMIHYNKSHVALGEFCCLRDGLSTYWFSQVELWLLMFRLGFSGSLAGFAGRTGGGSSSSTQLDLVSFGGCDLVPLLWRVSSSALMDRPTGFLGGGGLAAGAGGVSSCETIEGLAATGGLFVSFLGSGSGLTGSVGPAGPPWLSKAWIRAWILR